MISKATRPGNSGAENTAEQTSVTQQTSSEQDVTLQGNMIQLGITSGGTFSFSELESSMDTASDLKAASQANASIQSTINLESDINLLQDFSTQSITAPLLGDTVPRFADHVTEEQFTAVRSPEDYSRDSHQTDT